MKRLQLIIIVSIFTPILARAQFTDCSTGLLQMPTAEMQADGTFMITNNFLNKHSLASSGWNYNTFQYGLAISFWERMEIGYVCTIFNGAWDPSPNKTERQRIIRNQDRHFTGRVKLLREGDGFEWMPALVFGISDPVTGGLRDYLERGRVDGSGNGFFNRQFFVLTKHFRIPWGVLGAHAGYQFNRRKDYALDAPCIGIDWQPIWFQGQGFFDRLNLMAEYDSRTVNLGFVASFWNDGLEAMFEVQNFQWINFGLRYKLCLKRNS